MIEEVRNGLRGYTDGNTWYPAVGTILDVLHPAPMEWIAEDDLAEGAACHKEMEQCLTILRNGGNPYDGCTIVRVRKFLDWFTRQGFTIVSIEKPEANALHGFVGRSDIVVLDNQLKGLVLEAKYAESLQERYEVQAEAYTRLDAHKGFKSALVQITRAGIVKAKPLKPSARHWAAFLSALGVHKWRMK
ncbi:MAG: hypothetical protein CV090_09825 [Nitrospira sp. WS238]|nr:hypothetical protein [Nitrospira sp. WS238]